MSNDRRIILNEFLRVGDVVVVQRDQRADLSYVTLPPDGTEALVVSIATHTGYVESNECWSGQPIPGVYEHCGAVTFIWRDGNDHWCRGKLDPHHLVFKDESFDMETRRNDEHWKKSTNGVWVGPLPELPFAVGDRVSQDTEFYENQLGTVARIDYNNIGKTGATGQPMGYLDVQLDRGGTLIGLTGGNLTLVKRGNHYHYRRGEYDQLSFADLREEAAFYSSVGKSEQLRNPNSDNYAWTKEEALEAIRNGEGDVIRMTGGMFGSTPFPTLYRYPELPDLGRRLREETLKGFGLATAQ